MSSSLLRTAWRHSPARIRPHSDSRPGLLPPPSRNDDANDSSRQRGDGQVLAIFAVFSLVLIGILALSIDAGYLMAQRRQVQAAVDAGALAAAHAGMNSEDVTAAGQEYGAYNAGVASGSVLVSRPPSNGPRAGNQNFVQVSITKPVQRFFVGALYSGPWQVTATATAGIVPQGTDVGLLSLNSSAGGIRTSGQTYIEVIGGSIVSNYNIDLNPSGGSTTLRASESISANDGIRYAGGYSVTAPVIDPGSAEIADPLAGLISPPTIPGNPGNPVISTNPSTTGTCRTYNPWTSPVLYSIPPTRYTSTSGSCVNIENIPSGTTFEMQSGNWKFDNGSGINVAGGNSGPIILRGGTWNFSGSNGGVTVGGYTPNFEMQYGNYSFLNGARINLKESNLNNVIGGGNYYFRGGGGITASGQTKLTLGPGTYIFDGGTGLSLGNSDILHFNSGNYTFYFLDGADMRMSGQSRITYGSNVYVKAYFIGGSGSNWSDLDMSGSTSFSLPSGEYYFDHGRFLNSGQSTISGSNVFLYFTDGGYLSSTGSASFGFTAPTTEIYPGYYPGVFMYSDRSNTATFEWHGSTSAVSKGTVYLPSSPVIFGGASGGKSFEGQFIADRFTTGGTTGLTIEFKEYVSTKVNRVFLVD